jgi:hypothetical protein
VAGRPPDATALYAWLSRDAAGAEGMLTMNDPLLGAMPMVVTDLALARKFTWLAREMASLRGQPARLVRFDRGETLQEVAPAASN